MVNFKVQVLEDEVPFWTYNSFERDSLDKLLVVWKKVDEQIRLLLENREKYYGKLQTVSD